MEQNDGRFAKIIVKSQKELDAIPMDFKGRIYVEFGTPYNKAIIKKNYYNRIVARNDSTVVAYDNSTVEAWGSSTVVARNNSTVKAYDSSTVKAYDNSTVEARGNTQVVDCLEGGKIEIEGNARIVYNPRNIHEFIDFHGIKYDGNNAVFYKAVHKKCDIYYSDYDNNFRYEIGSVIEINCDKDISKDCSYEIHISNLDYALSFGKNWRDIAILEVSTNISDIVLPQFSNGMVRTSKCEILRETPLEECGVRGKIISKKLEQYKASRN